MNRTLSSLVVGFALSALFTLVGCGSDVCMSQCLEAQDRGCTTIRDCDRWCTALDDVASGSGCRSERNAIDDCAGSVDACAIEASCSAQGNQFAACAQTYCTGSPTPAGCAVLLSGGR